MIRAVTGNLSRNISRIVLILVVLIYAALVARSGIAAWILAHPTQDNLRTALRWMPGDPALWSAYARARWDPIDDSRSPEVIASYQRALLLNPFDLRSWRGLADENLRLGKFDEAEFALRADLAAAPRSPSSAWRLANFLVQQGRPEQAFPFFRTAAAGDPALRRPTFELGWKLLGDPQQIFTQLVPPDVGARSDYLDFLAYGKGVLKGAFPIWEQMLPAGTERLLRQSEYYIEALAAAGIGAEAERGWRELAQIAHWPSGQQEGEKITNGNFENSLRNAGLDWHLPKGDGFQISLDNLQAQGGTRSLRVRFDGTANPDFASVYQFVPVEPNRNYHFQAFLRTENVTTDNGIFLVLTPVKVPRGETWVRQTEVRIGSTPWSMEQLDFRTGPNTQVVLVQVRRMPSAKLNNLFQGTIWLDGVSLRSVPR